MTLLGSQVSQSENILAGLLQLIFNAGAAPYGHLTYIVLECQVYST